MLLKRLARVILAVVALAVAGGVWLVWFAGPGISVKAKGSEIWVDTRGLGEYLTEASEIQVSSASGEIMFRATSQSHGCESTLYRFIAGANQIPFTTSDGCAVEVPHDGSAFTLRTGQTYTFSLVGNNLFGNYRRATRRFVIPRADGTSPNNASQLIHPTVAPGVAGRLNATVGRG